MFTFRIYRQKNKSNNDPNNNSCLATAGMCLDLPHVSREENTADARNGAFAHSVSVVSAHRLHLAERCPACYFWTLCVLIYTVRTVLKCVKLLME
jgi:hypothetical protein